MQLRVSADVLCTPASLSSSLPELIQLTAEGPLSRKDAVFLEQMDLSEKDLETLRAKAHKNHLSNEEFWTKLKGSCNRKAIVQCTGAARPTLAAESVEQLDVDSFGRETKRHTNGLSFFSQRKNTGNEVESCGGNHIRANELYFACLNCCRPFLIETGSPFETTESGEREKKATSAQEAGSVQSGAAFRPIHMNSKYAWVSMLYGSQPSYFLSKELV